MSENKKNYDNSQFLQTITHCIVSSLVGWVVLLPSLFIFYNQSYATEEVVSNNSKTLLAPGVYRLQDRQITLRADLELAPKEMVHYEVQPAFPDEVRISYAVVSRDNKTKTNKIFFLPENRSDVPPMAAEPEPQQVTTHTINMGKGCRIRMQLPTNGRLTVSQDFMFDASVSASDWGQSSIGFGGIHIIPPFPYEYEPKEARVGLNCYILTDDDYDSTYVRFDKVKKVWVKNMTKPVNHPHVTLRDRRALERSVRFQPLQAVNASGYLYTNDDITGEEDRRVRNIAFGLVHKQRILSGGERGSGIVMHVNDPKSRDLTPYLIPFLQTIEFLEDDPAEIRVPLKRKQTASGAD